MSMTLTNAKLYVAGIMGGTADSGVLDRAAHAIRAAAGIWNKKHSWSWCRKSNIDTPITVAADVGNYQAPADFFRPYTARLVTLQQPLTYARPRDWERLCSDPTTSGYPWLYTIDNITGWLAAAPYYQLTLFRTPSTDDTLVLRYYRRIDGDATTIDVPDELLYDFLDMARVLLLTGYNSRDARIPILIADIKERFRDAISADVGESEDEDTGFTAPNWIPAHASVGGVTSTSSGSSALSDSEFFPGGMPV